MIGVGIALVLLSAVLHAAWNFLVKRASASGATFIFLFTIPAVVLLAPVALLLIARQTFSFAAALPWLVGSAFIHTAYFLLLQRGYLHGDLSVVYPVARGAGPLLAALAAVVLFSERPSLLSAAGALAIIGGTVALALQSIQARTEANSGSRWRSVVYGLAVGAFIGVYTVWDKHLVTTLAVQPVVLEWLLSVSILLIVTPAVLRDRALLAETWRRHRWTALSGALLSSASYILFLTALRILPVTRAAPLRESSVLIGAFLGARLLGEGRLGPRVTSATIIMAGIILLSVG
jgi:drug/metabolite transporter (DMT)-like permease